ncbi:MAG: hypothetical protein Q7V15_03925 [Phenylobacterium sp.]|uniref:hypothetical protein n=1 Tax=Phenylobacterium sp. TaxID=1871053 RepID=UPI002724D795|nr:hypothetical protein [Phenylobacterium sp.]MDO8900482.1 hypothetical protein [Phenylobacterium sp.]
MDQAFLIQFTGSMAAVAVLVGLAAWARIGRPAPGLDEARARDLLGEDFPEQRIDQLWIAREGKGALARSGACALVLVQVGDGYAARRLSWCQATSAMFKNGLLDIRLGEVAAPRAVLAFDNWPPADLAA